MSEIPGYYSQDAVDAQHEQMMKEFGILGEEIENLKAENKRLKEENEKLKSELRGKENEINDLKALVDYLRQFRPNKEEITTQS